MLIYNKKSWKLSENEVTDEKYFNNRRSIIRKLSSGIIIPLFLNNPALAYNLNSNRFK